MQEKFICWEQTTLNRYLMWWWNRAKTLHVNISMKLFKPMCGKKNTPHFQKKWWTETLGLIIFEGKKTVNSTSMFSTWKQETRGEQEFLSKHQEALLYYAVSEHWNRLPGEALETLSMEIFKSHLDVVLDNLLLLFGLSRGVEPDVLQRSIPISTILWLYDSVCNQQVD